MIFLDNRTGSKDLYHPLRRAGLDVDLVVLPFGDLAFEGRGEGDTPVQIGIEYKHVGEAVMSIRDGRLAGHQLPGLVRAYDWRWLLIEGAWETALGGELIRHERRGKVKLGMTASELRKHLLTYQHCAGVMMQTCETREHTLKFVADLYHWWTDRALDKHTSHLQQHRPPALFQLNQFRRTVSTLPGIGRKTSKAVQAQFGTLKRAFCGTREEWASVAVVDDAGKTKRLGATAADKVLRAITEEDQQ